MMRPGRTHHRPPPEFMPQEAPMPYYEVTTKFVLKGEKTLWVEARSANHARGIVQRLHRGEEALDLEGEAPIPITTEYTAGPPPRITGVFVSTSDRKVAEGCREA